MVRRPRVHPVRLARHQSERLNLFGQGVLSCQTAVASQGEACSESFPQVQKSKKEGAHSKLRECAPV